MWANTQAEVCKVRTVCPQKVVAIKLARQYLGFVPRLTTAGLHWALVIIVGGCGGRKTQEEALPRAAEVVSTPVSDSPRPVEPDPVTTNAPLLRLPAEIALQIEQAVLDAVDQGHTPGAAVAIGSSEHLWFSAAYGDLERGQGARRVSHQTIYDLSSLTKPLVTAFALAQLVEQKKVSYDDPVAKHLPCFASGADSADKSSVTVAHLLLHTSGLPPVIAKSAYEGKSREAALNTICRAKLTARPGGVFRYSDIGYVILGALVEKLSGEPLERYFRSHIATPLGLETTRFGPLPKELIDACVAPTEYTEHRGDTRALICGQTHDPVAWRLGGVAGNAGLFSTAPDLSRYAQTLLRMARGTAGPDAPLSKAGFAAMITPRLVPGGRRNYGWDVETGYSKQRAEGFSDQAFGHSGFAGTSLWLDPVHDLFVLFLSNRVYPDGKGEVRPLQRRIAELALEARSRVFREDDRGVLAGIDVLESQDFALLAGSRVGLITNNAARTRDGRRTIDALVAAGVSLVRLFSPEHGLSAQREGKIADTVDARSGTPVVSLFGENKQPRSDAFANLDVVLFDLQDVGVRFYTYQATMRRAMEAAAQQGVRFVVLDRPNPLGAARVLGPTLDAHNQGTFINHYPLPLAHGMTMGELSKLFSQELKLTGSFDTVPLQGWSRTMTFTETQLPWFAPSPNLPDVATVQLYPAVALVEGTAVSVGRGTEVPFQVIGAPTFDARAFIATFDEAKLSGIRLDVTRFTPGSGRHRKRRCDGVRLHVEDTTAIDIRRLGYALVVALARTQPHVDPQRIEKMIGDQVVSKLLLERATDLSVADVIEQAIRKSDDGLSVFRTQRKSALLYSEPSGTAR